MLPNVFISSTIIDLNYLREVVRDTIIELSYLPIMSEFGDISYMDIESVDDACLTAIENCQIAIIIIGKRYGSIADNGLSITHNEFRKARELGIPTIILINKEVLSFKNIYDSNKPSKEIQYPGMEDPIETFKFIDDIKNYTRNNGYIPFDSAENIRKNLKKQFAHFFGKILTRQYGRIENNLSEILSEVKTLRYELLDKNDFSKHIKILKYLLSNEESNIGKLLEFIYSSIENSINDIIESNNFDSFLSLNNWEFITTELEDINFKNEKDNPDFIYMSMGALNENNNYMCLKDIDKKYAFVVYRNKIIKGNKYSYSMFFEEYKKLKEY